MSSSSRADLLLGGRYRLGGLLGSGGMADVYEGIDERLGRRVAVKLLRPEMAAREDVRQRFEAEARSAASLSHPNVVGVFDTGEDDDTPYIVMERLPGETVADRMRAGPLDFNWTLQMARDVLAALAAAHAAGIVHRDVKPGNVLIADDGRAKVADFGIAKSLEVAAAADLTGTNQVMGTPAYVAPERILGQPATPQADIYAVGVVLYEALAGRKPFSGDTPVATAYAIQHETPPPLAESRPELPGEVTAAVERAMARDPRDRFGSASEMASALGLSGGAAALAFGGDATVAATMTADASNTQVLPAAPSATEVPPQPVARTRATLGPVSNAAAIVGDRRRMLLVGGVALLVLLFVAIVAAATGAKDDTDESSSPAMQLAADLREEAEGLGDSDGAAAGQAAEALRVTANFVENGGGGREATALLGKLSEWRDSGQLAAPTVERLAGLLGRVPGVDPSALTPPTTAPPPTTAAPKDDDEKEEEEKKDDGKGKGKGD